MHLHPMSLGGTVGKRSIFILRFSRPNLAFCTRLLNIENRRCLTQYQEILSFSNFDLHKEICVKNMSNVFCFSFQNNNVLSLYIGFYLAHWKLFPKLITFSKCYRPTVLNRMLSFY